MIKPQDTFFRHCLRHKTGTVMVLSLIITLSQAALAVEFQSHNSIYKVATDFMTTRVTASGMKAASIHHGRLDSRLHLKYCDRPLVAFSPRGSRLTGRTTVGVRCEGSQPWSLHVPLTVSVMKTIAVAKQLLPRGSVLHHRDIMMKKVDLATLPQGYIDKEQVLIGQKLKRRITAGAAFTPTIIIKPDRIKRGQRVTILARSGTMEVRMTGKALSSGAVGERIKVVNLASKRKREGVVTANGEVRIAL